MEKVTLQVEGMSCDHCVRAIEGALKEIGAAGKVNLAAKTVDVQFDAGKVTLAAVKEAIEDQGYDVA
ncbi:copper ion binding protein [Paenibacillus sp. GD4]|uniref:copper ion binding protein n=1 Tax=Paenibacillus TaxID=44249 RepID=UPI002543B3EB|nr:MULTISPECIES: copper ion binding protein [Paenibacillus]MDQ1910467.1 copper ion binding protein [Paenibacillus sp. GD4]